MNTHRHPASTLVSLLSALCLLAAGTPIARAAPAVWTQSYRIDIRETSELAQSGIQIICAPHTAGPTNSPKRILVSTGHSRNLCGLKYLAVPNGSPSIPLTPSSPASEPPGESRRCLPLTKPHCCGEFIWI